MRLVRFVPAFAALLLCGAASAQAWDNYVNREDFFTVNFPGEPARQNIVYTTAKGSSLPAHVYTAEDARARYSVTVVDYRTALDELPMAIEEARQMMRSKGTVRYEGVNMLDNHRSWRMTVETPEQRVILAEILVAMNNRLYLSQAETTLNVAPPAQFQASLQILNEEGVRIRYREVQPASPDEVVPVTPQARALESARVAALIAGAWRDADGGSCEAAFYRAGERVRTSRGEEAMTGTIRYNGMVISGQLILQGPREGQLIDPMTDRAILLFDPSTPGKITFSAIGPPALGWPDVTTERCPASRG